MYIKYFILLFVTCESKIKININTSHFINKTKITYVGSDIKQVTDREIQLFNITNENLRNAVEIDLGKKPDEVFLKDPTAYGDLFKKYKWPEVRRKLVIRKAEVVELVRQDVELKSEEFINNATVSFRQKTDISEVITNTVTATYKNGLPDDAIFLNVFINFGYENVTYEARWRDEASRVFKMQLSKIKSDLEIPPGKTIKKKILAEKIILLIAIDFEAHLIGNIVANYAKLYGKYHFFAPTIGDVMVFGNITNKIATKMFQEVIFYTNGKLKVIDNDTGSEISLREKERKRRHFNISNFHWFH